jgi:hypothetical protein
MKVSSTSSTGQAAGSSGPKPAAEGFRLILPDGGVAARAPVAGAGAASGVTGVSALFALQGVGGPEARARALRKGRRILDALDRLQLAVLGEGPTRGHLRLLNNALSEQREMTGDQGLDETLNWAEVRAAVEAAKLERAAEVA